MELGSTFTIVIIKQKMNKVIYILIIACFTSCKAQKGDGVLLNPTLKPGLNYSSTVITENNSTIEYLGNQGVIDNLAKKGIEHPITSISSTVLKSSMRTGEKQQNGSYKLECSYDTVRTNLSGSITKLKDENNLIEKMEGAKAFGFINNNHIKIDSIVNLDDESLKATLEQSVSNMLGQIEFPNRKVHIGESFTIETPMKMPTENGVVMDMKITNTYRLDSINETIAFFNIDQLIESTTSLEETELEMNGSGVGKLYYNIKYDTYELYETEIVMNSIVEVSGIKVKTKAITKSITKTKVKEPDDNM